jgi:hypothetical protein
VWILWRGDKFQYNFFPNYFGVVREVIKLCKYGETVGCAAQISANSTAGD